MGKRQVCRSVDYSKVTIDYNLRIRILFNYYIFIAELK
jgi:hypothetical protein